MNYQEELEQIEQKMDNTSSSMKWHEDKVKVLDMEMDELQEQWNNIAAEQELVLTIHHLKRFFDYLKITDMDPQKEFFEYVRCVLAEQIEGEIENIANLIKEVSEKVKEKE